MYILIILILIKLIKNLQCFPGPKDKTESLSLSLSLSLSQFADTSLGRRKSKASTQFKLLLFDQYWTNYTLEIYSRFHTVVFHINHIIVRGGGLRKNAIFCKRRNRQIQMHQSLTICVRQQSLIHKIFRQVLDDLYT